MSQSENFRRPRWIRRPNAAAPLLLLIAAASALGGCMLGPNYEPPQAAVADTWRDVGASRFTGEPQTETEWWKLFGDPTLESLVSDALAQNLSLQAAALRIVQARVAASRVDLLAYPVVTGSISGAHVNNSTTVQPEVDVELPTVTVTLTQRQQALLSRVDGVVSVSGEPSVTIHDSLDVYDAGFDAIWELDLWGEKRRHSESKLAEAEATYASYDDIRVSLAAEVASDYIKLRTLQNRQVALRETVGIMEGFVSSTEDKYSRQEVMETDVVLARTFTGVTKAGLPALEQAIRQTENKLCVLLGLPPQSLRERLGEIGPIPQPPTSLPLGVPGDLLRRRPDVRMVERLAHAECARIGIAKARILPSLSILGSIGLRTSNSEELFDSDSVRGAYGGALNINGILFYPFIVDGVRIHDAKFEEAMLAYREMVLVAAMEVENAVIGFLKSGEQADLFTENLVNATRAKDLSLAAYSAGKVIVSVPLVALGIYGSQADASIERRGATAIQLVSVYKGLGGGWETGAAQELVPEEIRTRMHERTDWWTFSGPRDLNTTRAEAVPSE